MQPDQLELIQQARQLINFCRAKQLRIVAAESCTGGLVASTLTDVAGASDVFERGFVTYSNDAKQQMLGVPHATLTAFGAVSRETAQAMASGALEHAPADLAIAITGIAGPGGAVPGKPVGLVHFAVASRGGDLIHEQRSYGDIGRTQVRCACVGQALAMLRTLAERI